MRLPRGLGSERGTYRVDRRLRWGAVIVHAVASWITQYYMYCTQVYVMPVI